MGLFLVQMLSFFIFLYFSAVKLWHNIPDLNLVNEACSSSCWGGQTRTERSGVGAPGKQGLDIVATSWLKCRSRTMIHVVCLTKFEIINDSTRFLDIMVSGLGAGSCVIACTFSTRKSLAVDVMEDVVSVHYVPWKSLAAAIQCWFSLLWTDVKLNCHLLRNKDAHISDNIVKLLDVTSGSAK